MSDYSSLSHTRWECKYHLISIPKHRCKVLYGKVRVSLGPVFHFVSTVGIDEATIREYIRNQEENDRKRDQNRLF